MYKTWVECKICKKNILGNVWHIHVAGKKHIHYTPKKITVTGNNFNSDNVEKINNYFKGFGNFEFKVIEQDKKVAIEYTFKDRKAHSKIIYKEHWLFNEKVKVTWEEVTEPPPFQTYHENAKNNYQIQKRPAEKQHHSNEIQRRPKETQKRLKEDSEQSLQALLLSLKTPETFDEQVRLLKNKLQPDIAENEKKRNLIKDDLTSALSSSSYHLGTVHFFGSSVTDLDVQGSDLDIYISNLREERKPEVFILKGLLRSVIYKSRKFCDILLIAGAKIPIIKCIHTKTQMCCDLNIRNKLSVCNSQLIRYYLGIDDKIAHVMIMIKFWANQYDLKKVNFFSSYAIYMMVIFYLQQEPYKIPSVKDLQKNIEPDLVEGWNCAFEVLTYESDALKNETIENLVMGFFKFYSTFDYTSKVVSPYFGTPVDKIAFLKPYDLPDSSEEYSRRRQDLRITQSICIQDPFEHSRNVANVPLNCIGKFVLLCNTSLKLMKESSNELLFNLLTQKPDVCHYTFSVDKPIDVEFNEFKKNMETFTNKILTDICAMRTTKQPNSSFFILHGTGDYNVWEKRSHILKNLLTQLPTNVSYLDKEIATTKCIIKYLPQTLNIRLTANIKYKEEKAEIILTTPSKKCKNFLHVSYFFQATLTKLLTEEQGGESCTLDIESITADQLSLRDLLGSKMISKDGKTEGAPSKAQKGKQDATPNQVANETSEGGSKDNETSNLEGEKDNEDEDIPADFFDDFANEDFMDGLDIVDAWDEDKLLDGDDGVKSDKPLKRKSTHSPIKFDKSPEKRSRRINRSRSLTKRFVKSSSSSRKRSKSREKARSIERRDPEKTKRDINRDKVKVAKDREQKIVNDKLKIVETGLVPPGMEMESDIHTIMKQKARRPSESSTENPKKRYTRRSNSREPRKLVRHSPSPPYRPRPREREPPYRPRKRTNSAESNLSDREKWIRSHKRPRSRTRSRSRDSIRRTKARKHEEIKKKSFLEEIRDKLNETRPTVVTTPTYSMPGYNTVPAPVPAPYFPPAPQNPTLQQYDQNFFIGENFRRPLNMVNPPVYAGNVNQMQPRPMVPIQPTVPPAPNVQQNKQVSETVSFLTDIAIAAEKKNLEMEASENIDKLFADKKISLSDFLTITAKPEVHSSSPEHLQKKIKVISRCQDAIKTMSDDRKFTGRLSVRPTSDQKNKSDVKYQSPLRRIPVVRFMFTTPSKTSEEVDTFAAAIDKILQKVGILRDAVDLTGNKESELSVSNSSFADEEMAALTLKASSLVKKLEAKGECEECKKRKLKTFAEVGSQCADKEETVSIATQVNEEELVPKVIAKNESIALLTPAQLLGKSKEKEESITSPEKRSEKQVDSPKEKPKPSSFKASEGYWKTIDNRQSNFYEYDYENDDYDYNNGSNFEEPRGNFERRYGGPGARAPRGSPGVRGSPGIRGPRGSRGAPGGRPPRGAPAGRPPKRFQMEQYMEQEDPNMMRTHQFREEANFTDFNQPYRGRGGRFVPRY